MKNNFLKNLSKVIVIASYPVINLFLFNLPAKADWNEFTLCSIELQKIGIEANQAGNACAEAIEPKDLSSCAMRINYETPISAPIALDGCFRVRRPLELSQCVGNIYREIIKEDDEDITLGNRPSEHLQPSLLSLDYCRRSLLPLTFSECVVGISNSDYYPEEEEVFSVSFENALSACIDTRVQRN